ncbi:MAG: histidine kinase [Lactobacillus sp.]|nr:histidine kinase [Lactobacillus sp.]
MFTVYRSQALLGFAILLLFLKIYRDGFVVKNEYYLINIFAQLTISMIVTVIFKYPFLMIYTGFFFSTRPRYHYRKLVVLYYALIVVVGLLLVNSMKEELWYHLALLALPIPMSRAEAQALEEKARADHIEERVALLIKQNERDRISQSLHDNLGQVFSTLSVKSDLAKKLIKKDPDLAEKQVAEIAQMSRNNLNLVREIVKDLRTETISEALFKQGKRLEDKHILMATKNHDLALNWPMDVQSVLSNVFAETVNNCLKYSKAHNYYVDFFEEDHKYQVLIHDDGIGFGNNLLQLGKGFGIQGIKNSVHKLNGHVDFYSDDGAYILIEIPKKEQS